MRRIALVMAFLALGTTSVSIAADRAIRQNPSIRELSKSLNSYNLVWLWEEANNRCLGSIQPSSCYIRADLNEVLKERGFCSSELPENGSHWRPCYISN